MQATKLLALASFVLGSCLIAPGFALADITSTNYAVTAGQLTGGTGDGTSTNYEIEVGTFVTHSQGSLSSTNYALGSPVELTSPAAVAEITSVIPVNYTKFFSDSIANYTVSAVDPDSDTLQYKAYQDATLKDGAQTSNELTWSLSNTDIGRRTVELQVVDPDGTIAQAKTMYVVRRPVK